MDEQWRDVGGYEGLYQVSDRGQVRSLHPQNPLRILRLDKNPFGYLRARLCRNGTAWHIVAHRLVAEAFLGPCPDGYEANHKNGDPSDNRVGNLEWTSHSENVKHSYRVLGAEPRRGENHALSKLTAQDVREIRRLYATHDHTLAELGERFGVSFSCISCIVNRKSWKHIT